MFVGTFFQCFGERSRLSSYGRPRGEFVPSAGVVGCKVSLIVVARVECLVMLRKRLAIDGETHKIMISRLNFELF